MLGPRNELACQQVVELVSDYLEGALSRSQRRRFEAHLADCEHCTEYLEQMRATIRLTGCLVSEDLTPEMREDFTTLYRRWREEGDGGEEREERGGRLRAKRATEGEEGD